MTWAFRVVRTTEPDGSCSEGVYEVYFDATGVPTARTDMPRSVFVTHDKAVKGSALLGEWLRIGQAFSLPVLTDNDFRKRR